MITKDLINTSVNQYGIYGTLLAPYFVANGTDDYATKAVNLLPAAESGSVEARVLVVDGVQNIFFESGDAAATNKYILLTITTARKLSINVRTAAANNVMESGALLEGWHTVKCVSTGTAYGMVIDGVVATFTATGGTDDGNWFADVTNRDDISIGALRRTTVAYGAAAVAWVKVDEGVNGWWVCNNPYFVYDKSANANHLTIGGSGAKIAYGSGGSNDLMTNGYSKWIKAASPDIQVPYTAAGAAISLVAGTNIPAGYSKDSDISGNSSYYNFADALFNFDPTGSTDSKLDVFDKSNSTIHVATGSMAYYNASYPYGWLGSELKTYTEYNAYFNAAYQDRLFTKVESGLLKEILNCWAKQSGDDLVMAKKYCEIV